eukprot:763811-Hanusia_phi.AAC.6
MDKTEMVKKDTPTISRSDRLPGMLHESGTPEGKAESAQALSETLGLLTTHFHKEEADYGGQRCCDPELNAHHLPS